ncbi:MAG: ATP-binding cassette domain-containing protein [Lachnospiraceae bacterium]|nr:ATP-binding cassette domain-containing protein [Lachnospiraceae bacterium]
MSASIKKPEIIVFAGPNGSGKSTFTELLKPPVDYINADEIKKNLKCSDLEAAQLAEKQREEHVEKKEEFCFETVMSTDRNLNLLKRAKEAGFLYAVIISYVRTRKASMDVGRANRAAIFKCAAFIVS